MGLFDDLVPDEGTRRRGASSPRPRPNPRRADAAPPSEGGRASDRPALDSEIAAMGTLGPDDPGLPRPVPASDNPRDGFGVVLPTEGERRAHERENEAERIRERLEDPDLTESERTFLERNLETEETAAARLMERERENPGQRRVEMPREPDPFKGEGLGETARRRGQQFARGATEVIAAQPEAAAVRLSEAEAEEGRSASDVQLQRARQRIAIRERLEDPELGAEERELLERNLADLEAGRGVLDERRTQEVTPARERNVYAYGETIREASEGVFGKPDPRDQTLWAKLAEGGGNLAGFAATAGVGTAVGGPTGGLAAAGAVGSGLNAAQVYDEAIRAGADEETAREASGYAGLFGATEALPVMSALRLLPRGIRQRATNTFIRRMTHIAKSATEEAAQEAAIGIANNLLAQNYYDPERGWDEDLPEQMLIGGILGGGIGAAGSIGIRGEGQSGSANRSRRPPDAPKLPPLTREDRESPVPDDLQQQGREILAGIAPPPAPDPVPPEQSGQASETPRGEAPRQQPSSPAAAPERPAEQPASDRYEELPETDGDGTPTGASVWLDRQTGRVQRERPTEAQPAPEPTRPEQRPRGFGVTRAADGFRPEQLVPSYDIDRDGTPGDVLQRWVAEATDDTLRATDEEGVVANVIRREMERRGIAEPAEASAAPERLTLETLPQQLLMLAREQRSELPRSHLSAGEVAALEEAGTATNEAGDFLVEDLVEEAQRRADAGQWDNSMALTDNSHIEALNARVEQGAAPDDRPAPEPGGFGAAQPQERPQQAQSPAPERTPPETETPATAAAERPQRGGFGTAQPERPAPASDPVPPARDIAPPSREAAPRPEGAGLFADLVPPQVDAPQPQAQEPDAPATPRQGPLKRQALIKQFSEIGWNNPGTLSKRRRREIAEAQIDRAVGEIAGDGRTFEQLSPQQQERAARAALDRVRDQANRDTYGIRVNLTPEQEAGRPAAQAAADQDRLTSEIEAEAAPSGNVSETPAPVTDGAANVRAANTGSGSSRVGLTARADRPLPDFSGVEINGYEGGTREDGRDAPAKRKFETESLRVARAVDKELRARGWTRAKNGRGKEEKPSFNPGGIAVSGDTSINLMSPDGESGAYLTMGQTFGPQQGVTLMARRTTKADRLGTRDSRNEYLDAGLRPSEIADRLERIAGVTGTPDDPDLAEPTEAEMNTLMAEDAAQEAAERAPTSTPSRTTPAEGVEASGQQAPAPGPDDPSPFSEQPFRDAGFQERGDLLYVEQDEPDGTTRTYRARRSFNHGQGRWELVATRTTTLNSGPGGSTSPPPKKLGTFTEAGSEAQAIEAMRADGLRQGATSPEGPADQSAASPQAAGYGANNTLVSQSRREEIAARLRDKLRNQSNAGLDPELLSLGTELMVFHVEAGARRFAQAVSNVADDLGMTPQEVSRYARAWYNGARDMIEDSDLSVEGMDDPQTVLTQQRALRDGQQIDGGNDASVVPASDSASQPAQSEAQASQAGTSEGQTGPTGEFDADLATGFQRAFEAGERFTSIVAARKRVEEFTGRAYDKEADAKRLEEAIEVALVRTARGIVAEGGTQAETYQRLVDLYARQPNLTQRTSTSVEQQAFSTPAPLAYLASRVGGIGDPRQSVYEPSAGNGMLLVEVDPASITAGELNENRLSGIRRALGDAPTYLPGDAMTADPGKKHSRVIANPPFGRVYEDGGGSRTWEMAEVGGQTREIDHAITMKALANMRSNGRAVFIIGGQQGDAAARKAGYQSNERRKFFKKLYDTYDVAEHVTVDGKLYAKQGAEWPVDIIVVNGRGQSTKPYPMKEAPPLYSTWDDLGERLNGTLDSLDTRKLDGVAGLGDSPAQVAKTADTDGLPGASVGSDQTDGQGSRGGRGGGADSADGRPQRDGGSGTDGAGRVPGVGEQLDDGSRGEPAGTGRDSDADAGPGPDTGDPGGNPAGGVPEPSVSRQRVERENTEAETAYQVQYAPRSQSRFTVGTLVPRNMQQAMDRALDALERKVSNRYASVDEYVAGELGYSLDELLGAEDGTPGYFSAEQVDALALAIDNVSQGAGMVVGDQTGVGKGRVVAAMLRYGQRQGLTPVFVTKDPALYEDMVRDLREIGMPDEWRNVFVTNKNMRGKDALTINDEGDQLMAPTEKNMTATIATMQSEGKPPEQYGMVFTTYSQMQAVKGEETDRMRALRAVAPNAMFVLDESHEAGGTAANARAGKDATPPRSVFVRELVNSARGTVFSSATYAKNPQVMSLYAPTDLRMVSEDINELSSIIEKGGVPLQQVLANMLVEAGQYARRERSYEGVEMGMQPLATDRSAAERGADVLRTLFQLDLDVMQTVREAFIEGAAEEGVGNVADNATGKASMTSTNFSSTMHNLAAQFLLAIKVDSVVENAIARHKAGEKVIITLSNTNASIIEDAADRAGVAMGGKLDVPFNTIAERYLDRLRRITVTDENDNTSYIHLTDEQIRSYGGDYALKALEKAQKAITDADLSALPGAPIDAILDRLEAAGVPMGEITGRNTTLPGGVLTKRDSSSASKKETMRAFNRGDLDGLVINRSGSTGFSLHALGEILDDGTYAPRLSDSGAVVNDAKPRHMFILQPEPNIDLFMQMLGRIHRTGQIRLPAYTIAVSDLSVEKRPAAVLMRKMASLNANTTASKKSAVSLDGVVDFLNPYGDQVVLEWLRENREIATMLDVSLDAKKSEGVAAKLTGRLASMPPDQVDEIYADIERNYTDYIDALDRMGMNALEAKALDLDARTISSTEIVAAKDETSPFGRAAYLEQVSVKQLGKPMTREEVDEAIAEAVGATDTDAAARTEWARARADEIRAKLPEAQKVFDDRLEAARAKLGEAKTDKQKEGANKAIKAAGDAAAELRARVEQLADMIEGGFIPGRPGRVTVRDGEGEAQVEQTMPGIAFGVDTSRVRDNPGAASAMTVRIAIADAGREIRVPLSKFLGEQPDYSWDPQPMDRLDATFAEFEAGLSESRETRQMVTGNIPSGFGKFGRGQVVLYTDSEGRQHQGVMLPKSFDAKRHLENKPVAFADPEQVSRFLKEGREGRRMVQSDDATLKLSFSNGAFQLGIATKGHKKYTLNKQVRALLGDFEQRKGAKLFSKRITDAATLHKVMTVYAENLGTTYETRSERDAAREITGEVLPDLPGDDTEVSEQRAPLAGHRIDRVEATEGDEGQPVVLHTGDGSRGMEGEVYEDGSVSVPELRLEAFPSEAAAIAAADERARAQAWDEATDAERQAALDGPVTVTPEGLEPLGEAVTEEVVPDLQRELDRQALGRVRLALEGNSGRQGAFTRNLRTGHMTILVGQALDPRATLYHESIHAMRALNLFSENEWDALVERARTDWLKRYGIRTRYGDKSLDQQIEEAIAEAYAEFATGKARWKDSPVKRAVQKIRRLMLAIRRAFTGRGYETAEDVFGAALAGEIGRRSARNTGQQTIMAAQEMAQEGPSEPVARLTGDEIGSFPTIKEGRKAVVEWYLENLRPTTITNAATGWNIRFSRQGATETASKLFDKGFRLVPSLPAVLRDGQVTLTEPDRDGNRSVRAWHTISAPVELNGELLTVRAKVREQTDGTYHYMLGFEEGGTDAREQRAAGALSEENRSTFNGLAGAGLNISAAPPQSNGDVVTSEQRAATALQESATRDAEPPRKRGVAEAMEGGIHVPDRRVFEELTASNAALFDRLDNVRGALGDRVDAFRVQIQDKMLPLLRQQQAIEAEQGFALPDEQDAYRVEEQFAGVVGRKLEEIDRGYTKPIINLVAQTDGLDQDLVGRWLYARHAVERNEQIAEINDAMPDGGSGMSAAEAETVLAWGRTGPHADALREIGRLIDRLRERVIEERLNDGLLTEQEAETWRTQYRHYVPLKGFAETDHSEASLDTTGTGRRYSTRGGETRRALGRGSEAFNPLVAALTQAQEATIRGQKNRVGRAVYELVKENPAPGVWKVETPRQKRYYNRATGMVETRTESPLMTQLQDNQLAVKVDGREVRMTFEDPRLARALGSVGPDQMGPITRAAARFSRFFSSVNTMLNPEFIIQNAFRDVTTASINMQAFGEKDRAAITKGMLKDWKAAFTAAFHGLESDRNTEWGRWWREFEQSGAKVSFWKMEQPEAGSLDFRKRATFEGGNAVQRSLRFLSFSTRDNPVLHQIERANLATDNAVRLGAYVHARKAGWSKLQSASLARNLTVNFNRRGEIGASLNAFYPFFNAAVQGSHIILKAGRSKRVQKIMLGMVAAGFVEDMVNSWLSDEDEDGELAWDKIPDWKHRRNFMIPLTGSAVISIPMPYGYNVFPYMGKQLGRVVRGNKKPGAAVADVLVTGFESFSPIAGASPWQAVLPTMAHPMIETAFNVDWQGRPIRPEDPYGDYGPDAYKYFAGASDLSRFTSNVLNRATGGSRTESGFVDVSPEYLDHVAGWATGGFGRFTGRVSDLAINLMSGDTGDLGARDIPFARQVVYETSEWLDRDRYYRFREEVREAMNKAEQRVAMGQAVPSDVARIARLDGALKAAERSLRAKRQQHDRIEANTNLNRQLRQRRLDLVEQAQNRVFLSFNKRFLDVVGSRAE